MREPLDKTRLLQVLEALGKGLKESGNIYLTGGASALIEGWREMTIDLDLSSDPEPLGFYEAIAQVKNELSANIELAAPSHFAPALPHWRSRSLYIETYGKADFYHYDFYSQAFVKIIRNHTRDRHDVCQMLSHQKVEVSKLLEMAVSVENDFLKYPRLDYEKVLKKIKKW